MVLALPVGYKSKFTRRKGWRKLNDSFPIKASLALPNKRQSILSLILLLQKRNLRVAFLKVDRQDDAQRDDSGHKDVDDDILLESAKCTVH